MTGFILLRPSAAVMCLALLAGCSGTSFFGDDEIKLSGDRIAVRQASPATRESDVVSNLAIVIPDAVANADWSQFNGDAAHAIGHVAASGSLQQAWRVSAGTGSGGRIVSPPVVFGGRVYTLDAAATVAAHDAGTGARIWRRDITPEGENSIDGFGGGLAASDGRLFVSSGFGKLFALDLNSGEPVWEAALRAPSRSAPIVSNGRVFVVTRENRIFAFDAITGEPDWNEGGLEQTAGILGGAGPAATDEIVIAPYSSGELSAYLVESGRPIWEEDLTGIRGASGIAAMNDVSGDPVIADGTVYAASQSGRLAAIDIRSGARLWTRNLGGSQAPYIAGNALFFMTEKGEFVALDRETGNTVWSTPLGAFEDPDSREDAIVWAGPVLAGGRLLLTSSTERLIAVDPVTGGIVAEVELPDPASTPPVVAGGTIFVLTDDADLVAYR